MREREVTTDSEIRERAGAEVDRRAWQFVFICFSVYVLSFLVERGGTGHIRARTGKKEKFLPIISALSRLSPLMLFPLALRTNLLQQQARATLPVLDASSVQKSNAVAAWEEGCELLEVEGQEQWVCSAWPSKFDPTEKAECELVQIRPGTEPVWACAF